MNYILYVPSFQKILEKLGPEAHYSMFNKFEYQYIERQNKTRKHSKAAWTNLLTKWWSGELVRFFIQWFLYKYDQNIAVAS